MKTVLVSSSRSPHGNTLRVATTIAEVLDAPVITPAQATPDALASVTRVGFGSGIYWMGFDAQLVSFIQGLPDMSGKEAFVFATSGLPEPPFRRYTQTLEALLKDKGFSVTGTFTCRGIDTWGPFKLVGGVSKDHPNELDLAAARAFAATMTS